MLIALCGNHQWTISEEVDQKRRTTSQTLSQTKNLILQNSEVCVCVKNKM
jgi:hypothetical protein